MPTQSKPKTKKAQLIQMLTRKAGADVTTISEQLGWLPHTTRAALTGLRKAGFEISAEKNDDGKPACYRIIAEPTDASYRQTTAILTNAGRRSFKWIGRICAWPGRRPSETPRRTSCRWPLCARHLSGMRNAGPSAARPLT